MSVASKLLAAPATVAAREALASREDAWIVGGAVRDAFAGNEVTDLDLAVADDEADAARRIAAAADGFAFELSAEFATWRAVAPGRDWHVDVTRLRGSGIEADLGARDFTVNAIAVPLAAPGAEPLDPFGGVADIDARRLRVVSERSFVDDPLRILRAARLGAQLGFEIEPKTVQLARAAAGRAGEPAGERQLAELRLLVAGPDPLGGLRLLDELDATAGVLPELAALHGVEQNPNHHLDVHGHTIEVLRRLLEVEGTSSATRVIRPRAARAPGRAARRRAQPRRRAPPRAILHDVGKPATRREHEGGFVSFVGHDREGAALVATACARLKASRTLTRTSSSSRCTTSTSASWPRSARFRAGGCTTTCGSRRRSPPTSHCSPSPTGSPRGEPARPPRRR